jgi:hypothetical protein
MSDAIKCFRTITRCGLFRQIDVTGTIVLVPVGLAVPPQSIMVSPGDSIEEPQELALDGREVTSFTYTKAAKAELELKFGMGTLEMEALIHGRVAATGTSIDGWVYAEFVATSVTPYPARAVGMVGKGVTAQTITSKAQVYYIDPVTKLAQKMTVVATAPATINEVEIGADMAITISAALAATGYNVYAWVPQVIASATILSGTPFGILSLFAMGLSFDNKARIMIARNLTRLPGGGVGAETARDLKFRVLPDPTDGTGLGYSIIDTPSLSLV